MRSKILILGKGYIGKSIADYLHPWDNIKVVHVAKKQLDYTNQETLKIFLEAYKPDYVVNCAGYTGKPNVDKAEEEKELCWKLNVVDAVNINRACRDAGVNYIHIGSGCIYNGIIGALEDQVPNFGLYTPESSFYSKSKHAYETIAGDFGLTLRIRMPFDDTLNTKNYLYKLWTYPELMGSNTYNSKTQVRDIGRFILYLAARETEVNEIGLLNFVNPSPKTTYDIVENMMEDCNFSRSHFEWVEESELNLKAKRSNCCLASEKRIRLFPDFHMDDEEPAIRQCLSRMRDL